MTNQEFEDMVAEQLSVSREIASGHMLNMFTALQAADVDASVATAVVLEMAMGTAATTFAAQDDESGIERFDRLVYVLRQDVKNTLMQPDGRVN